MGLDVNIVCRNYQDDRVIPRFCRYLSDNFGWNVTSSPDYNADLIYLSGYFESQMVKVWPDKPVAAYFTHLETQPPGNGKAKLFHAIARRVQLRIATAAMYSKILTQYGDTVQVNAAVERHNFIIPKRKQQNKRLTVGLSGYSYRNGRKGENIAKSIVRSEHGRCVDWKASGRGWPVPTRKYKWSEMPGFYQSLDILMVTSTVEGVSMPPLECLSCGVSVVLPRGVGLFDELPDVRGIHRYKCGDAKDAIKALGKAIEVRPTVDRAALRAVTEPFSIMAWCEQHRAAFEELAL